MTANKDEDSLDTQSLSERTRARILAMQALYELDATNHSQEVVVRRRLEEDSPPAGVAQYMIELIDGVRGRQEEIDSAIAAAAPAWPLDQMARVDKSILRLAIFEMIHQNDVPPKVAINEAVEVAKQFGHESSPKFVNGVLGTIERQRRAAKDRGRSRDADSIDAAEDNAGEVK